MRSLMLKLWKDDCGALIATEWVFVATILVLGSITGLVMVRQAVLAEFQDMAQAIMSLDQSYSFTAQSNCESSTAGSAYFDLTQTILNDEADPQHPGMDIGNLPCD
jgi:Flp pilus assembly pilin Flp